MKAIRDYDFSDRYYCPYCQKDFLVLTWETVGKGEFCPYCRMEVEVE